MQSSFFKVNFLFLCQAIILLNIQILHSGENSSINCVLSNPSAPSEVAPSEVVPPKVDPFVKSLAKVLSYEELIFWGNDNRKEVLQLPERFRRIIGRRKEAKFAQVDPVKATNTVLMMLQSCRLVSHVERCKERNKAIFVNLPVAYQNLLSEQIRQKYLEINSPCLVGVVQDTAREREDTKITPQKVFDFLLSTLELVNSNNELIAWVKNNCSKYQSLPDKLRLLINKKLRQKKEKVDPVQLLKCYCIC